MRAGQVAGGAHECVVVQHVEDAGHRLHDVVLAQIGLAAVGRPVTTALAVAEAAAPPALPTVAVVVAVLLPVSALLIAVTASLRRDLVMFCIGLVRARLVLFGGRRSWRPSPARGAAPFAAGTVGRG